MVPIHWDVYNFFGVNVYVIFDDKFFSDNFLDYFWDLDDVLNFVLDYMVRWVFYDFDGLDWDLFDRGEWDLDVFYAFYCDLSVDLVLYWGGDYVFCVVRFVYNVVDVDGLLYGARDF
jgi:hypothetical protein